MKITVLNLKQRKFVANDFINTKRNLIRHLHLNEQGSTQRRNQQKLLFNEITNSTNFDEAPVYGASTFAIVVIKHTFLKSKGVGDFGGKWCKNTFFLEKKTSLITKWSYYKIHVYVSDSEYDSNIIVGFGNNLLLYNVNDHKWFQIKRAWKMWNKDILKEIFNYIHVVTVQITGFIATLEVIHYHMISTWKIITL